MSIYYVAGRDLEAFVTGWLANIEPDTRKESLLTAAKEARAEGEFDSEYLYNGTYLYSEIGPKAAEDDASDEELLLAAVLAMYQRRHSLFRGMRWTSQADHVERAFRFAQETGDAAMARLLIEDVISRGEDVPEAWRAIQAERAKADPAREARHDSRMAELAQRELRAAVLFDPTADFDSILLDPERR